MKYQKINSLYMVSYKLMVVPDMNCMMISSCFGRGGEVIFFLLFLPPFPPPPPPILSFFPPPPYFFYFSFPPFFPSFLYISFDYYYFFFFSLASKRKSNFEGIDINDLKKPSIHLNSTVITFIAIIFLHFFIKKFVIGGYFFTLLFIII